MPQRYAVLMTCFNRRELTLETLRRLFEQEFLQHTALEVFAVDDGSTDGTTDAIRQTFPSVHLLSGDGSLFWNGGMRLAFASAVSNKFAGYFWLNDDTFLERNACQRVLSCAHDWSSQHGPTIGVGSVADPVSHEHAYGGLRFERHGVRADFVDVKPDETRAARCDSMNGNFVYVPHEVTLMLGNLDGAFTHQYGDLDYGLRASRFGIQIVAVPGYVGVCKRNSRTGTWQDETLPFWERWNHMLSPKGVPPLEWFAFVTRHYTWRWPVYLVSPFAKLFLITFRKSLTGRQN